MYYVIIEFLIIKLFTYIISYLLTHSMEQSTSSEANRFSVSQEFRQNNPFPTSHFLKTHLSITPIYTWVFQAFFSLRFPTKTLCTSLLSP